MMLCGWGVNTAWLSFHMWKNVWVTVKLYDPLLTHAKVSVLALSACQRLLRL